MSSRNVKVGKSQPEKQAYQRYIRVAACDPTMPEKASLSPSDEESGARTIASTRRSRPYNWQKSLEEHLQHYWGAWVISGAVAIGYFFIIGVKFDIQGLNFTTQENNKKIAVIETDVKSIAQKNNDQDLKIQDVSGKVDVLNQRFTDLRDSKKK